jgi:hypothetical protein
MGACLMALAVVIAWLTGMTLAYCLVAINPRTDD